MNTLYKVKQALGLLAAPFAYNLSRLARDEKWAKLARKLDPQYHRAFQVIRMPSVQRQQISRFQIASQLVYNSTEDMVQKVVEMMPRARSQFLQDIFVALALNEKKNGYFVEVGVGSGERISNTYMLEKSYGWSGLLVEPNRSFHESINVLRGSILEKRAAAGSTGDVLRFEEFTDQGEFSRLAGARSHKMDAATVKEYDVETITLTDIFTEKGSPNEIDFISIDTEGSEVDILKGIDFGKYIFKVMVIEHNHHQDIQKKYADILEPHGYRLVMPEVSEVDAWYVHRTVEMANFPKF
jgi:FkbM family methyltransferase